MLNASKNRIDRLGRAIAEGARKLEHYWPLSMALMLLAFMLLSFI